MPSLETPGPGVIGWDIGGAHVKAAWWRAPRPGAPARGVEVVQHPCPLWQGLQHLESAVDTVFAAWPGAAEATQALTMTGELADGFEHREAGVAAIAQCMAARTGAGEALRLFAGQSADGDVRWCAPAQAAQHWSAVASANWLATAMALQSNLPAGAGAALLVDIGSTTTDLIPLHAGAGALQAASDADRLAEGQLVYQGVVRTPLCALGPRVRWRGRVSNVMNEFFATTADVYRLTGELEEAHDQHPSADQGPKTEAGSRSRIARMIGRDARDGEPQEWQALARQWRARQLDELAFQAQRVLDAAGLPPQAPLVAAGCGDFLVRDLAERLQREVRGIDEVWGIDPGWRSWVKVAAPAVAIAMLAARSQGEGAWTGAC